MGLKDANLLQIRFWVRVSELAKRLEVWSLRRAERMAFERAFS